LTTTTSFVDNAIDFEVAKFLSPEFGIKFHGKYPNFWRYPNFLIAQCGIGGRKPPCPARFVKIVSIQYRLVTDRQTRRTRDDGKYMYRASI